MRPAQWQRSLSGEKDRTSKTRRDRSMLNTLGVALTISAASNIDGIFVLLGFFGERKFDAYQVFLAQCLSFTILAAVSLIAR